MAGVEPASVVHPAGVLEAVDRVEDGSAATRTHQRCNVVPFVVGRRLSVCRVGFRCRTKRQQRDEGKRDGVAAMSKLLDVQRLLALDREDRIRRVLATEAEHGTDSLRGGAEASCAGGDSTEQQVGALVLGSLGIDDRVSRDLLVQVAARLVSSTDVGVRVALAEALGLCSTDGRMTGPLLTLADDADPLVRLTAVQGLSVSADDEPEDGGEVAALLLRRLEDSEPRRSRTSLSSPLASDATPTRRSCAPRSSDFSTMMGSALAGEAAVSLARRGDERVLPVLLEHLADLDVGNLWVEAAAELGHSAALPALISLRDQGWGEYDPRPEMLVEAINRCSA